MTSAALDRVFAALSSPARRKMLDIVQARPGITIAEVAERFRMTPVGVLKHVKLLERAKLLTSRREGRVRHLYFNAVPIQQIYDRWTDSYSSFWAGRMLDIKERLEAAGGQRAGLMGGDTDSGAGGGAGVGAGAVASDGNTTESAGQSPGDGPACLPTVQPHRQRSIRSA